MATPEHLTGLHLHGINLNTPQFRTLPSQQVSEFAKQWGFIPTASHTLKTVKEVKEYAKKVSTEGKWNGDPIEGFVVRSTVKKVSPKKEDDKVPPYPPGSPFFFKIKFDEPYLMYRQWREITRTLLPLLNTKCRGRKDRKTEPWTSLGSKTKRPESKVYAEWVGNEMLTNPSLFEAYTKTGIIRVREAFMEWTQTTEQGRAEWAKARTETESRSSKGVTEETAMQTEPVEVKYLIVPVAIPGLGKTILGEALKRLIPELVHEQSDNVTTKSTGPTFLANVVKALGKHDIVYADRYVFENSGLHLIFVLRLHSSRSMLL